MAKEVVMRVTVAAVMAVMARVREVVVRTMEEVVGAAVATVRAVEVMVIEVVVRAREVACCSMPSTTRNYH